MEERAVFSMGRPHVLPPAGSAEYSQRLVDLYMQIFLLSVEKKEEEVIGPEAHYSGGQVTRSRQVSKVEDVLFLHHF